ncbi:MAG: bifunctional 5,10-methylenetetrahydrofolate dehydrogenase/5,10-methenyltetrahydrofolate cyclohydrolase [Saprospiraceae bacterium]|nr:bifunctional 5,10-methylenetetrahydrofolate dehydrogenase/5,10-methenyltetrahydrofolate cyclohydrolase [Saprospiraceae bacterium]
MSQDNLIDGKALSGIIREEIRVEAEKIKEERGRSPKLVAVIVGENPASQSYVRGKVRACDAAAFNSETIKLPDSTSEEALIEVVLKLNTDESVDGFIVQLPLPDHINSDNIIMAIDPKKDVDGFHPVNFGKMAQGLPAFLPATPFGIITMLERYGVETSGKQCVVLGRSNIVGTPISILMSRKAKVGNATVTLTHSRTKNLKEELRRADIIIAAIGIPNFVTEDMVKDGVVVIDVGINRVEDSSRKSGYKLVGDVDFEPVRNKASLITPVPGGVGPMTVCSLLWNTLLAAKGSIYK